MKWLPRRRCPTKRTLIVLVLFIMGGAIINVAVAWGCAAWSTNHHWRSYYAPTEQAIPLMRMFGIPLSDQRGILRVDNAGFALKTVIVPTEMLVVTFAGWPSHTLCGGFRIAQSKTAAPNYICAIELSNTIRPRDKDFPNWAFVLPLRPLWPGFAINTIFYAAILWMLFTAPGFVRRRIRVMRHRCPACGYLIGASPVCTECGMPVSLRRNEGK